VALRVRISPANREVRNAQQVCGLPDQVDLRLPVSKPFRRRALSTILIPSRRPSHRLAGTAIDVFGGLRACDPKRLAIYFTKHSSPNTLSSEEYQHPTSRPASVNGSLAGHMGPDPGKHFRAVWASGLARVLRLLLDRLGDAPALVGQTKPEHPRPCRLVVELAHIGVGDPFD
jgi:hypothetical protein